MSAQAIIQAVSCSICKAQVGDVCISVRATSKAAERMARGWTVHPARGDAFLAASGQEIPGGRQIATSDLTRQDVVSLAGCSKCGASKGTRCLGYEQNGVRTSRKAQHRERWDAALNLLRSSDDSFSQWSRDHL